VELFGVFGEVCCGFWRLYVCFIIVGVVFDEYVDVDFCYGV